MKVTLEIHVPEDGDFAPSVPLTPEDVRDAIDHILRFEDVIPWYGEARHVVEMEGER